MNLVLLLILITGITSYRGFVDSNFFNEYKFQVDGILRFKEYRRMVVSGFLHANWMHLGLNMYVLYIFADVAIAGLQGSQIGFLILYMVCLLLGNALALFIHRNYGNYSAIGASGATSGVVYAAIVFNPDMQMGLLFIPFMMPAWAFGALYMLYTIFGIKSQRDNIGHEAHLGGAAAGMILAIVFAPSVLNTHGLVLLLMLVPLILFFYLIVMHPEWLLTGKIDWSKERELFTPKEKESTKSLDELLEKVERSGYDSLTPAEKKRLDQLSK